MAQLHGKKIAKTKAKRPAISEELKLEIAERMKRRELLSPEKRKELDKALLEAAAEGEKEKVMRLLKKGADIDAYGNGVQTALLAAAWHNRTETVKLLIKNGADINKYEANDWQTPLMTAIQRGDTEACAFLIEKGADVDAKDRYGQTALTWALEKGHTGAARILMQYKIFGKDYREFSSKFEQCVK